MATPVTISGVVGTTIIGGNAGGQKLMKEDVSDIIYNISPTDTPFMSSCKRGSTKNTLFQWNLDKLADAKVQDGVLEGERADGAATLATDSVLQVPQEKNYTQIFRKLVEASGTIEAVDLYGRKSEMAYQMAKKSQEIKRDIETTLLGLSNAPVGIRLLTTDMGAGADANDGATGIARVTRNFANIVDTHQLIDSTSPATIDATSTVVSGGAVPGTPDLMSPAVIDKVMRKMWEIGADFDFAIPSPKTMEAIADFAISAGPGLSGRFRDSGQAKKVVNVVDVYVSPYGEISMVLDRFMPPADPVDTTSVGNVMYFIDPKQLELKYLRSFSTINLAKMGDSEKKMIIAEFGLVVKAPQGCGILYNFKHA